MEDGFNIMKFRRRRYITNKTFQFRMLGRLLVLVFLATVISIVATHFFILSSIISVAQETGRAPTGTELIAATIRPLFIVVPIVLVIVAIIVIFISHRVAGPLIRLKQFMGKVGEGDLSVELKFRKYDEIHDVADSFNKMVEGLRKLLK